MKSFAYATVFLLIILIISGALFDSNGPDERKIVTPEIVLETAEDDKQSEQKVPRKEMQISNIFADSSICDLSNNDFKAYQDTIIYGTTTYPFIFCERSDIEFSQDKKESLRAKLKESVGEVVAANLPYEPWDLRVVVNYTSLQENRNDVTALYFLPGCNANCGVEIISLDPTLANITGQLGGTCGDWGYLYEIKTGVYKNGYEKLEFTSGCTAGSYADGGVTTKVWGPELQQYVEESFQPHIES